jgi:ubiquinone/menaquinone biosynthesis C-methylase UbiE
MGFYDDIIVPYCVELSCGMKALQPLRERATAGLHGNVLEIGFGSALNVPLLPAAVTQLRGVDPSERALRIGRKRLAQARCPVEVVGLSAERIDVADGWADTALSTFTLCTIPDVAAALAEVRRILKPGGRLFYAEHGRAPERGVQRWQDRLNGMQRTVAGGCNLNRDIPALLTAAGFALEDAQSAYLPGAPRTHAFIYSGAARRA